MPYIGNSQVAGVHQNNFKILDDISSYTETFDGSSSSVVNTTNNTITVSQHRFYHGQRVTYNNGGGSNIGGLTSGTVYYAVADSHQTIQLAATLADALSNTAINLSSVGSGTSHTLNNSFDGVNTKFKLTHSGGVGVNLTNASHATVAINNVVQRPNLNDISFTEGFAIEGGKNIVFKVAPSPTDTFWGNTIAESVGTFDTTVHTVDSFTADGVTTNFILSKEAISVRDIHVTLDGVTQHTTAISLQGNLLIFSTAPANGTAIQVKHMGFVGATTSGVTGFYGRLGNVALQDGDVLRGDGSLITNIGIPGISTSGTSNFFNVGIAGTVGITSHVHLDKDARLTFGDNPSSISGLRIWNTTSGSGNDYSYIMSKDTLVLSTILGPNLTLSPTTDWATFHDTEKFYVKTPLSGTGAIILETDTEKVKLNHIGNTKLETSATGITVTGEADINGNLNISGVSTFSNPVSIAATTHFASQTTYFGPVLNTGEISIDLLDNGIAATFDHNDTGGLGLFIRTGSDLYLLADHKTNTASNGDGYGLIIQSGSGNIIPSHDYRPQLGLSNREFGTIFADQLNISGISTFGNDLYTSGRVSIGGENPGHFYSGADNLVVADFSADAGISIFGGGSNKSYVAMGSSTFGTGVLEAYIEKTHGNTGPLTIRTQLTGSNIEIEAGNNFVVSHANNLTSGASFAGTLSASNYAGLKVEQGYATNSSLSGTFNYDFANGHVQTYMSATSGNYTPNFRVDSSTTLASKMNTGGNSGVGDAVSATLIVTSSSHYCASSVQVDGTTTNVTTEWVGGSAPSAANGSGYDIYSFTIVKTASTPAYTVFANAIAAA